MRSDYDFIIIGGGSAGCIVAARLAENSDAQVLLLEAGPEATANPDTLTADGFKYAFSNDNVMWDRFATEQEACGGRKTYAGTGTGMGGSGSVNGMVYTRGNKQDFDQWPKGWQWNDISPAFDALESRLRVRHRQGTAFTESALQAAEGLGFQRKNGLNDGDLNGFMGYNDMNFEAQSRRSSYMAYLHESKLANLTIVTGALVEKINFADKTAISVSYRTKKGLQLAQVHKEVVLCAGALETPKLLMLSGVGPKAELDKHGIAVIEDAPAIGQNLQDHPNVCMFFKTTKKIDFAYPQLYGFDRMNAELDLPEGQADTCFAWMAAPKTLQQSLYRMLAANLFPGKLFFNPIIRKLCSALISFIFLFKASNAFVDKLFGIVVILGKPLSLGSVQLASNKAQDQAIINPAYYNNAADMDTLLQGIKTAYSMAKQPALQAWGAEPLSGILHSKNPEKIKKWAIASTMTTFHFCGSCKMGDAADAPVASDLKLKHLKGIRVADASVIPVIPVSAINAPSMMIGYRAADFILRDMQKMSGA